MSDYLDLQTECCEANLSLPKTGLVDLTFGNVSVADPERRIFAIKPSGVDYRELTPAHMVVLDYEGHILEGSLRPSSDTPTHRCLFLSFPGIRSVVHTHSRRAVSFAQAGRDLPAMGTTHADYFHGHVPVTREMTEAEVTSDYEWETGQVIVETFRTRDLDPLAIPAVLVRNHGPFAWGPSGAKAVEPPSPSKSAPKWPPTPFCSTLRLPPFPRTSSTNTTSANTAPAPTTAKNKHAAHCHPPPLCLRGCQ